MNFPTLIEILLPPELTGRIVERIPAARSAWGGTSRRLALDGEFVPVLHALIRAGSPGDERGLVLTYQGSRTFREAQLGALRAFPAQLASKLHELDAELAAEVAALTAYPVPMPAPVNYRGASELRARWELRASAPAVMAFAGVSLVKAMPVELPELERLAAHLKKSVMLFDEGVIPGDSGYRNPAQQLAYAAAFDAYALAVAPRMGDASMDATEDGRGLLLPPAWTLSDSPPAEDIPHYASYLTLPAPHAPFGGYVGEGRARLLPLFGRDAYDGYPVGKERFALLIDALIAATDAGGVTIRAAWEAQRAWHANLATARALRELRDWLTERSSATLRQLEGDLHQQQEEQRRHTNRASAAAAEARNLLRQLTALTDNPAGATIDADLASVKRLLDGGKVRELTAHDTLIEFSTPTLYVQDARTLAWHELGAYRVEVNLGASTIKFRNTTRQVQGYRPGMQHPHVWESGTACPGNFADMQADLFIRADWLSLIEMSIAFLEAANTDDVAGRHVNRWPFVSDPASVGLPPYVGEVTPLPTPQEMARRQEAERLAQELRTPPGADEVPGDGSPFTDRNGFYFEWDEDADGYLCEEQWDLDYYNTRTDSFYDDEGYNIHGYSVLGWNEDNEHRLTGGLYDPDGYDIEGYDRRGFDRDDHHNVTGTRFDEDGLDRDGYDRHGFNEDGEHRDTGTEYNPAGYDYQGFDEYGFNGEGTHRETGTRFDSDGYDQYGYTASGFDDSGYHRATQSYYDLDGFDVDGYNEDGFDRSGTHGGTGTAYGPDGYDQQGFNADGIGRDGLTRADHGLPTPELREAGVL